MEQLSSFIRPHIKSIPAYEPILPFEVLSDQLGRPLNQIIKLDANENPFGISPSTRTALANMDFPHIYPDPMSRSLRKVLSDFTGTPYENLLVGAGADELIDMVMRIFLNAGDRVITCPPTFGMYGFDTELNDGNLVEVARHPDFSLDVDGIRIAVEQLKPKLLFLASPNNPDGSMIPRDTLMELLYLPLMIVIDEAYIEFADMENLLGKNVSMLQMVPKVENLIVLRTFSKWAGLAGLRVGYGAFPTWLMPVLWKTKQPYNINIAASVAAVAAISDAHYLSEIVFRLREERDRMIAGLNRISYLRTFPSTSNFVLCRVIGLPAEWIKKELAERYGILVRYFNKPGLTDCIRISVGTPEQTDKLLQALQCLH